MERLKIFLNRHFKMVLLVISLILTIEIAMLVGVVFVYQQGFSFPRIRNLEDLKPEVMTTLYDDTDHPVKEYAVQKRQIVGSREIPWYFKQAFIIAEDKEFRSHWGINLKGTVRAMIGRFILGRNLGGGSSITQQLARELFLTKEVTLKRKFQEMLLAIQLERNYSKDQILTFYLNMLFLGYNTYGVEAASRFYFGKGVSEVTLAEAVLLCVIPRSPNRLYNIFENPQNCLKRRNQVLAEMREADLINPAAYEEALATKLPQRPFDDSQGRLGYGQYFFEEVRRRVKNGFGDEKLYGGGLKIHSTLNLEMQRWAEDSLREGLRELDKRQGWRAKEFENLSGPDQDLEEARLKSWERLDQLAVGRVVEGVVTEVSSRRARVRIKDQLGTLDQEGFAWTESSSLKALVKPGDVILVRIEEIDPDQKILKLLLEQEPQVQGAIMVIDNRTGEVKAMAGGYDFEQSEFNRATQAERQPGSTMKPIIYSAAIENGYTPATLVKDEFFSYYDEIIDKMWYVRNDQRDYKGLITLRRAFEQSRNTVSARVVEYIGPGKVVEYGRRFGITSELKATHSIALGTYEVRLIEMVSAYTVFPNLGIRVVPYFIRSVRDRNNNILDEKFPDRRRVLDESSAYVINYMMQGVIQSGSGWRARPLLEYAPLGGKTGTMDGYTDAWFIGFSPSYTVGVWVGFDTKKTLGEYESGSRAASPIFVKYMTRHLEKYPEEQQEYPMPAGVIKIKIDKRTGKRYGERCLYPFWEAFLEGTEPDINDKCTHEDHLKISDYFDLPGEEDG